MTISMKFMEIPYERIKYGDIEERYKQLIKEFLEAKDGRECMAVIQKRNQLYADMTPMDICYIRHDMDVNDKFYEAEQEYYNEIKSILWYDR